MVFKLALVSIVSALVIAQDEINPLQSKVPESLQKLAANETTTNLRISLLNNSTRRLDDISEDVFKDIGDNYITYVDMVKFINETQQEIRKNANSSEPFYDAALIQQAAAIQMQIIGKNESSMITEKQMYSFFEGAIEKNFTFNSNICHQVQLQQAQCEVLLPKNYQVKSTYYWVGPRMTAVINMCYKGLTSLGHYRLEACQLGVAQKMTESQNIFERAQNCMEQYQCYYMPNERRVNPWNVTVPDSAVLPLSEVKPTALSLGAQSVMGTFFEKAFGEQVHRKNVKNGLILGGVLLGSAIFAALFLPILSIAAGLSAGLLASFNIFLWTAFFGTIILIIVQQSYGPDWARIEAMNQHYVTDRLNVVAN